MINAQIALALILDLYAQVTELQQRLQAAEQQRDETLQMLSELQATKPADADL